MCDKLNFLFYKILMMVKLVKPKERISVSEIRIKLFFVYGKKQT